MDRGGLDINNRLQHPSQKPRITGWFVFLLWWGGMGWMLGGFLNRYAAWITEFEGCYAFTSGDVVISLLMDLLARYAIYSILKFRENGIFLAKSY